MPSAEGGLVCSLNCVVRVVVTEKMTLWKRPEGSEGGTDVNIYRKRIPAGRTANADPAMGTCLVASRIGRRPVCLKEMVEVEHSKKWHEEGKKPEFIGSQRQLLGLLRLLIV